MIEYNTNSYYALVLNDTLLNREEVQIEGELIHKKTELPNIPKFLYGANPNDVAKILGIKDTVEYAYDRKTTRQSVKSWREVEELILSRSVRIIVWYGSSELVLPEDDYKIVTPELFQFLIETSARYEAGRSSESLASPKGARARNSHAAKNSKLLRVVQNKALDTIKSNQELSYFEDLYGIRIKARERHSDINDILYGTKVLSRADKSWKESKTTSQWLKV